MESEEFDRTIRGKNINFLIGSGASVPMYPTLSLGGNMPSFENIVSNTRLSKKAKALMYIYYFEKWIYPMGYSRKDFFEEFGNHFVLENYRSFIACLYTFLQGESNELPKRINIFTTNYDLLFERTFDESILNSPLLYFNDGSRGVFRKYISNKNYYLNITHSGYNDNYKREVPTVNLFKLHGSLSWKIDEDRIMVNEYNGDVIEVKKIVDGIGMELYKLEELIDRCKHNSIDIFVQNLNQELSELTLKEDDLERFFDSYSRIPIINPDKNKFFATVSEQHYYQLIRSFSYELERKQSILIVFGFSFADEHIKDIFTRSLLNPELQVIIISYSKEGQDEIKQMFKGYHNIIFLPSEWNMDKHGDFNYLLSLLGINDGE